MKTWQWNGSAAAMSGALESDELSTGTSRKPISGRPSDCADSAIISLMCSRVATSCGMNQWPTP